MKLGVSGHQQMPPEVVDYVRAYLAERLAAIPEVVGVSSLAVGADQLFADAVLAAGGVLHAIVPCQSYESTFQTPGDQHHYRQLVQAASDITTLEFVVPSEQAFLAAGKAVVTAVDELIAVWDGQPSKGLGGTADIVAFAHSVGTPVQVVWLAGATR
jgi:hypothetical protein